MVESEISNEEAVKAMLDFVNRNLVLDGVETEETKQSVVFTGAGENSTQFALEVVTSVERSIPKNLIENRTKTSRGKGEHRSYIFPRSTYHINSKVPFLSPYLRPAWKHLKLDELFKEPSYETDDFLLFTRTSSVALSNAEKYLVDELSGQASYYNQKGNLQIVNFRRYPKGTTIPAKFFVKTGRGNSLLKPPFYRDTNDYTKKFWSDQDSLRERVRKMMIDTAINQQFTLSVKNKKAVIIPYNS
jgi:hypothetical protein|tara:strand:- start:191 stop:925 length:735 start_codon:yes stop_codon:yes gene_type:complete